MKMVVTDLTRMYDGHICAAGIDLKTHSRVRPVNGRLPGTMLRRNGGPLEIGAIVELGPTLRAGRPPEVEDVHFDPTQCRPLGQMNHDEFFAMCQDSVSDDLGVIGPALRQQGRSLVTPEGEGDCSLVLLEWNESPHIFINSNGRLRFSLSDQIELSVTDVRLYNNALRAPDAEKVRRLNEALQQQPNVILALGLGRAWSPTPAKPPLHYLQLNNVHPGQPQHAAQPASPLPEWLTETDNSPPVVGDAAPSSDAGEVPEYIRAARVSHPRAYEPWSEKEDAELIALWRGGRTVSELADRFQRKASAIESRLKRNGFDPSGPREQHPHHDVKEPSAAYTVRSETVVVQRTTPDSSAALITEAEAVEPRRPHERLEQLLRAVRARNGRRTT